MAKNYVQPGDVVTVAAPANVVSGAGVLIGTLFGVATHDALSGTDLELAITGVWTLPAETALAINVGDRVFWVPGTSLVNKTAAAQQNIGVAVTPKVGGTTTVNVKLGAVTASGA